MAAWNNIKQGDVLWDCHRQKLGNTRASHTVCIQLAVVEIDSVEKRALCAKSGREPRWLNETQLKRLRRSPIPGADR